MKFKLLKPFDNICLSEKFCCPNAKGQERQAERKTSQLLKCGDKSRGKQRLYLEEQQCSVVKSVGLDHVGLDDILQQ